VKLYYGDTDEVTPVTDDAEVTISAVGGSAFGEVSLLPGGTDRASSKQVTVDGSTIEGYMWLAQNASGPVEFKVRGVMDIGEGDTIHCEETIVADSDTVPYFYSLEHVQEGHTADLEVTMHPGGTAGLLTQPYSLLPCFRQPIIDP